MVEPIYFLKPAWCGTPCAGLRPEQGLQPVRKAFAFRRWFVTFQVPPPDTLLDEPILWESVVAYVEFQGRNLQSIQFHPIAQNKIGEGQPDVHEEHADNVFLQTRGLPKLATGDQAHYILERLADLSRPFGTTVVVNGDMAEIKLKAGK